MMEPPEFGKINPAPRIDIEEEIKQRLDFIRESRTIMIGETTEERDKRTARAHEMLEDFCTGLLCGIRILKARE